MAEIRRIDACREAGLPMIAVFIDSLWNGDELREDVIRRYEHQKTSDKRRFKELWELDDDEREELIEYYETNNS